MKSRKIGQVSSKSLVNIQGLKEQTEKHGYFLNFEPSRPFVQNGDVPKKNTLLPGKSTEGAVKALQFKPKTKMLLKSLSIL